MGELQGSNTYVVGPGSTHPSGEIYDIKKDLPIAIISYDKFMEVFGEFIKKKKSKVIRNHIKSNWQGDSITDIPIGNIISFNGLTDVGNGCFQGTTPKNMDQTMELTLELMLIIILGIVLGVNLVAAHQN